MDDRIQPQGEVKSFVLGKEETQTTTIGASLELNNERNLVELLRANADLFAWGAANMPRIHPSIMTHKLSTFRVARPVAQRKRRFNKEKRDVVQTEITKLLKAKFIWEITYTTWLANVVMMNKSNGQWRMCVNFTDINKACLKESYPLPSIDRLVDKASGHIVLSFLDAYSGYNQIPMYVPDQEKIAFITEHANYCYEVMSFRLKNGGASGHVVLSFLDAYSRYNQIPMYIPDQEKTAFITEHANYYYEVMLFGLKNARATYQCLMEKIFHRQIGKCMEVYVNDMVVRR